MSDIRLRQQVPASPDVSVGLPLPGWEIWLTGQVMQSPDVSVYPTRYLINDPVAATGTTYTLAASPGALTLTGVGASLKVARVLTATPGTLTLSGGTATLTYTPASVLPNRGPFQCGLFQPNVFQNDCSAATTATAQVGHSGKPRRKRHYVEIEGQYFEVRDHEHAVEILTKLHEATKEAAKAAVESAVAEGKETPPAPVMRVVKPDYRQEFVQRLQAQVDAANAQIKREWAAAEQAYGAQQQALARLAHERWVEQDEEDIEALIALGVL